jgi:hypothetical protein
MRTAAALACLLAAAHAAAQNKSDAAPQNKTIVL